MWLGRVSKDFLKKEVLQLFTGGEVGGREEIRRKEKDDQRRDGIWGIKTACNLSSNICMIVRL